jgi:hypothetical protein
VVDSRRRAVAGALVEVIGESGRALTARTGQNGRFRIDVGPRSDRATVDGAVVASDDAGRAAGTIIPVEPAGGDVIDVGVLVLEPSRPLVVQVLEKGRGVAGARVHAGSAAWIGCGPFVTDVQGRVELKRPFANIDGSLVVRAFSRDRRLRGESTAQLPQSGTGRVDVDMVPAWRLGVVVVDAATSRPVAGVEVEVSSTVEFANRDRVVMERPVPHPIPPTDDEGRTSIEGLAPDRPVSLRIVPLGCVTPDAIVPGTEQVVLKHIAPTLVGAFPATGRALVVTVRDRAGAPVSGAIIECRAEYSDLVLGSAVLDRSGSARIEGYFRNTVIVSMRAPVTYSWLAKRRELGVAKIENDGESRFDAVVETELSCVLDITVDGEKRLPASFTLMANSDLVSSYEEDLEAARVSFRVRPEVGSAVVHLALQSTECLWWTSTIPVPADGGPIAATAALSSGGTLRVKVLPPADCIHDLGIESAVSWVSGGWQSIRTGLAVGPSAPGPLVVSIPALGRGRYRARDILTGLFVEASVTIGEVSDVTLDLSRAGSVVLRVEGPADAGLVPATVGMEGPGIDKPDDRALHGHGIVAPLNCEVRVRVPGDRPVTFSVKHPTLVPAGGSAPVTVTDPGASVVLKLVGR